MPARPLRRGRTIKILVFADSGWGKTRLVGTSRGKILLIRPPFDQTDAILPADEPRVKEWIVRSWGDMDLVFEHLRHEGASKYDWVWLDSISSFQDAGLDDIWETVITEKPARKRYGLDKAEYGINMFRLGQWVRDIASLSDNGDFHFGITAWPAELQPSEDEEVDKKLMPWVQGRNMANKICGYTKIVAFGEIMPKGTRVLRFMATDRYYAKDSFDMFDDYRLAKPTIGAIEDAVAKQVKLRGPAKDRTRVQKSPKRLIKRSK